MENILNHVNHHVDFIHQTYNPKDRFFTALQGSQNYNLADSLSDIDTKTLILPTLDSFIYGKREASTTLILPNNEHADIKDFRDMFQMFRKQNINFIEILFTPYVNVNPDWEWFYNQLVSRAEDIAHYNRFTTMKAMIGHLRQKASKFYNETITTGADVKKYGYDPKQLHHMVRIQDFLIRYVKDEPYKDILEQPSDIDYIKSVKRGYYTLSEAEKLRDTLLVWANDFETRWGDKLPNENNPDVERFLSELERNMMVRRMREVTKGYYAS